MDKIIAIYVSAIVVTITISVVGVVKIKQDIVKIKDNYVNKI